jgi:lactate racemase
MKINLLYGKEGKIVEFPEEKTTVILPKPSKPVDNEKTALLEALRKPIACQPINQLVKSEDTVAIVFSDITRAMPSHRVLPVLLDELSHVPDQQITLINALGTHRSNTQEELIEILGEKIVKRYHILQHDCHAEKDLTYLGTTVRGHEIWVNRVYMESSVRILTGFIEPHLFAGFSGGPKSVLPGVAGIKTINANHCPQMIGDPKSTFTFTTGNPIWEEMLEVAKRSNPTFILNVTLTDDRQITGVFVGNLEEAHQAGVDFIKKTAMIPVEEPFDIVVVTAGGYPMDISMYQSVKGIAVSAGIVKDGGAVILASECPEGLPSYGEYGPLMALAKTPDQLLEKIYHPGFFMQDQWDAQIQAQISKRVKVFIFSDGLKDQEIRQVLAEPCHSISDLVNELIDKYGNQARVAVLPAGPLSVPFVKTK